MWTHFYRIALCAEPNFWLFFSCQGNKAVLEPRILPAFTFKMTFDLTSVEITCVTLPKDHCIQVQWKYIKVCGYSDLFFQKLEPKVIEPYMTFDTMSVEVRCVTLSKDHCVQVPWEYINVDTVINFANYYILHTYYVQNEWSHSLFLNTVQARQKWKKLAAKRQEKKRKKKWAKNTIKKEFLHFALLIF